MGVYSRAKTIGSQADFLFEINGGTPVEVVRFDAVERLSTPFECIIQLAGRQLIQRGDVVQKEALLTIRGGVSERYFHGIIEDFHHDGQSSQKYIYNARVVPVGKLLALEQDCRIFQTMQVQEIITEVFKEAGISSERFEFRLKDKEHRRKFCVQYRETDLHFISRILEEEGIYYFFEHSKDRHVMVFADDPVCYKPIEKAAMIQFKPASGLNPGEEVISSMDFSCRLRPGNYAHTNYNFKRASIGLNTYEKSREEQTQKYEIYDYPGPYGDEMKGQKIAKIRLEESRALKDQARGESTCSRLIPGFTFTLSGHDVKSFNREYLLVGVCHSGRQPQTLEEQSGSNSGAVYTNTFLAIPSSVPYRPLREHARTLIPGLQTAVVVGPKGEEIFTDEYGRVRVQFHWDRKGKKDERSSCWLRCSQGWGGGGRGVVFIPRVGDEVVVCFLEGDPDWPIIIGSVYNGDRMPLYDLPVNKTRSTIKTRSYPNSTGFNELRFEDKSGSEEIFLHGEKDWNIVIKNDKGQSVGHDEILSIVNNRSKSVGVDQCESIGSNKTINVGANHSESIGGNMNLSVGNNRIETVGINSAETIGAAKELTIGGLYQVSVGGVMNETVGTAKSEEVGGLKLVIVGAHMAEKVFGNRTSDIGKTHTMKAAKVDIVAQGEISLITGSASIRMKSSGDVIIKGTNIDIKGAADVTVKGQKISSN